MPVGAAPAAAAPRAQPLAVAEHRQVAEIRVGDEHDVGAAAAVAAVRAALRHVRLAAEAERAVTAAARLDVDASPIVEHVLL